MTTSLVPDLASERIMLKCARSIEFVEINQIIRIESMRAYCKVYIFDDSPITLSFPLKTLESKLADYPFFFRCHKSHIINMSYVRKYHSDNGIILIDGSCVPLATALKAAFLEKAENLFKV